MFRTIAEGKARINVPVGEKISKELDVFYNPVMKFNRDISVLLLQSLGRKNLVVCDLLAASGVRSIRFLKELPKNTISRICINDGSKKAFLQIKKNLKLNKLEKDKRIVVGNDEANKLLLSQNAFDYIDIDPFGSPNLFLNNAVEKMKRNGILAVTATDTGALAGAFMEAGIRKYWTMPLKNEFMHENGLRILIRKVQLVASQHDMFAFPILGFYRDHYYRAFFLVGKGSKKCDSILSQHKYLLYCENCFERQVSGFNFEKCWCENQMDYVGPLWIGKIGDEKIIQKMLKITSDKKMKKFLNILKEECKNNIAGFYDMHKICERYKTRFIPKNIEILDALKKKGFKAFPTHFSPIGIKTDANLNNFIRIIRNLK